VKISSLLVAAVLLLPVISRAEIRTFTDSVGRTLEAELVGMRDGSAVLKLGGGRIAKVPLSSLSDDDQAYVKAWHEENKNKVSPTDVRLTIDKDTERTRPPRQRDKDGNRKRNNNRASKSETSFTCTLRNNTARTIEGISASYTIYKRVSTRGESGANTSTSQSGDTTELETLKPRGSVSFTTGSVTCEDSSRRGGNGPTVSRRESIVGVVITLSAGGEEFLKQSYPENLIRKLEEEEERQQAREEERESRQDDASD